MAPIKKRKSPVPSVRALDELKSHYTTKIQTLGAGKMDAACTAVSHLHRAADKAAIPKIIQAIESLGLPYKLRTREACAIRKEYGNNELVFTLDFDPSKSGDAQPANAVVAEVKALRAANMKALDDWYLENLYNIASRREISTFTVVN